MDGEPALKVTGQLGAVMSESAEIALSFVRSHREELGIAADAFEKRRFHVHVPAGAVPKDGPSAGITMTTAFASLLTGRPVKPGVGMTGEVTLQGRVLPIGGLKQKVLAAHRAGLTDVVIPFDNEGDLDDVPEAVRDAITFHPVTDVRDVLAIALEARRVGGCTAHDGPCRFRRRRGCTPRSTGSTRGIRSASVSTTTREHPPRFAAREQRRSCRARPRFRHPRPPRHGDRHVGVRRLRCVTRTASGRTT